MNEQWRLQLMKQLKVDERLTSFRSRGPVVYVDRKRQRYDKYPANATRTQSKGVDRELSVEQPDISEVFDSFL